MVSDGKKILMQRFWILEYCLSHKRGSRLNNHNFFLWLQIIVFKLELEVPWSHFNQAGKLKNLKRAKTTLYLVVSPHGTCSKSDIWKNWRFGLFLSDFNGRWKLWHCSCAVHWKKITVSQYVLKYRLHR